MLRSVILQRELFAGDIHRSVEEEDSCSLFGGSLRVFSKTKAICSHEDIDECQPPPVSRFHPSSLCLTPPSLAGCAKMDIPHWRGPE